MFYSPLFLQFGHVRYGWDCIIVVMMYSIACFRGCYYNLFITWLYIIVRVENLILQLNTCSSLPNYKWRRWLVDLQLAKMLLCCIDPWKGSHARKTSSICWNYNGRRDQLMYMWPVDFTFARTRVPGIGDCTRLALLRSSQDRSHEKNRVNPNNSGTRDTIYFFLVEQLPQISHPR